MRHPFFTLLAAGAFVVATLPVQAAERVLSIGGSVTEIIYALGAGDKLVARDTTSSYPEPALDLPDVGYIRALAPEGVLSVNPDLIIAEAGAGPVETLDVLTQAEIPFVEVPDAYTGDGILAKIDAVGTAIERPDAARALRDKVAAELTEVAAKVASVPQDDRKRVLFILSTRGGRHQCAFGIRRLQADDRRGDLAGGTGCDPDDGSWR